MLIECIILIFLCKYFQGKITKLVISLVTSSINAQMILHNAITDKYAKVLSDISIPFNQINGIKF